MKLTKKSQKVLKNIRDVVEVDGWDGFRVTGPGNASCVRALVKHGLVQVGGFEDEDETEPLYNITEAGRAYLEELSDRIGELSERPTAWAYQQACKALHSRTEKVHELETRLSESRAANDSMAAEIVSLQATCVTQRDAIRRLIAQRDFAALVEGLPDFETGALAGKEGGK